MGLKSIEVVSVPVSDQQRAKDFYASKLGFSVTADEPFGEDMRWVQLEPPGGGPTITLVRSSPEMPAGAIKQLVLACEEIDATQRELAARGVPFKGAAYGTPWGRFAEFEDPDGNHWILHEQGA